MIFKHVAAAILMTATGAIVAPAASAAPPVEAEPMIVVTFVPAGQTVQSWTVPYGVTSVQVVVDGAPGGKGSTGARVTQTIPVTAKSVLDIWVGLPGTTGTNTVQGLGGWGGRSGLRHGGNGGSAFGGSGYGSGGGGASEIDLRDGSAAPPVLIVAAGGGGAGAGAVSACGGFGAGGCGANAVNGRGVTGQAGLQNDDQCSSGYPGFGGDGGGGLGGASDCDASDGQKGENSTTGAGGAGGDSSGASGMGGGGGGGGFGGGGGGGGGDAAQGTPGGGGSGRSIPGESSGASWVSVPLGAPAGVKLSYVTPPLEPAPAGATSFFPLAPARLLDTRQPSDITGGAIVGAGAGIDVQISGRGGVPASNVAAVVLNVTVADAAGPGFVTVWPRGQDRATASNLNVTSAGQNIANLVTVRLGAGGMVSLYTLAGAHLVVDVAGYYAPTAVVVGAGRFTPLTPARVLDTRSSVGVPGTTPVAPNGQIDVIVTGRGGVPTTGVAAVVLNVTAASATAPGFVTVWPSGQERPTASTLNVTFAGQNIPNLVIVPVGTAGQVSLYSQSGTHLVADVLGWFGDASQPVALAGLFEPLAPARILDTRVPLPTGAGIVVSAGSLDLSVAGHGGVPATGAAAVVVNVTAAESTLPGFVTIWPAGTTRPTASNLNVTAAGQNIANLVTVGLSPAGSISLYTSGGGHLVADVAGYYLTG